MVRENLFHYRHLRRLLVANAYTQLSLILMVQLNGSKLIWLLKVIPRHMVLIMMKRFLQLPKSLMSVFLFLWLLILIGPYFSWMSKMPFYMGIYMRKFIWSNHLGLLLRGSIEAVSVS
jgi:hypothetical protein